MISALPMGPAGWKNAKIMEDPSYNLWYMIG